MNGDDLRDVRSGDPLFETARRHNALNDLLRQRSGSRNVLSGTPGATTNDPCDVRVFNSTTNSVSQFGIMGIDSPLNDPTSSNSAALNLFQHAPVFKGVVPRTADHSGRFVIAQEQILPGGVGTCRAAGCTPAQVTITSADDTTADLTDNDTTKLTSGSGVAEIVWKPPSATGIQWCFVRIGGGGAGLPPAQYPGMVLVSKADRTWSAGWNPLHDQNEGV